MKSTHSGFIPTEMYLLIAKMTDIKEKIRWNLSGPDQIKLSFTMYYEGGQWRHFNISYNLETFDYTFSCVYYYPDHRVAMGEEITKEEWEKLGNSVSKSKNAAAEIIPPNDPECLNWLVKKGVLTKTQPANAKIITLDYKMFEQEAREHLQANKEYNKQELKILVQERIRVSENIERYHNYLNERPTHQINKYVIDLSKICFLEAQKMNQMKTNQINPEHIVQIKSTFYGVIHVDTI